MRRAVATMLGLALALHGRPACGESFTDLFTTPLTRPIGQALADSIGRSLPVTAASSGVTFTFDPATGVFERETDILGQLFLERPRPLGARRWNMSLSYQWVRIDTVDGEDLDHLHDTAFPIVDPDTGRLFTVPRFGIELETHEVTGSVTYGLTDDLDVNLTVPILDSHFGVHPVFRDVATGQVQATRREADHAGVGDVFLRGKYRFAHGTWGDVAAGLVLRLPAGNEDDFQGTGSFEPAPALYAATAPLAVGPAVRLQVYANGSVALDADDVDGSEGRFGIGLDCRLAERATLAVAFLGREPFAGIAPPGFFDVLHVDPRTGRRFLAPVLGLSRERASAYDLSLGGRVDLWRDTVFGFANVIVPLNRDGFRSDVIPLAGVEVAF